MEYLKGPAQKEETSRAGGTAWARPQRIIQGGRGPVYNLKVKQGKKKAHLHNSHLQRGPKTEERGPRPTLLSRHNITEPEKDRTVAAYF